MGNRKRQRRKRRRACPGDATLVAIEAQNLSGENWLRRAGLDWGRAQGNGIHQQPCFPCECCLTLQLDRNVPSLLCTQPQRESEMASWGEQGHCHQCFPWGKATRSPKVCMGLTWLRPSSANTTCARAPGLVGRGKSSWKGGGKTPQPPPHSMAWGQCGHCWGSVLEGTYGSCWEDALW